MSDALNVSILMKLVDGITEPARHVDEALGQIVETSSRLSDALQGTIKKFYESGEAAIADSESVEKLNTAIADSEVLERKLIDTQTTSNSVRERGLELIKKAGEDLEHYREKAEHAFTQAAMIRLAGEEVRELNEKIHELIEVPVEKAMKLQVAIAQLGNASRNGHVELEGLSNAMVKAAVGSEYTATEVAQASTALARAGLTTEEAIERMPAFIKFASANMLGLADATDRVSKLMRGFQVPGSEAARVTDVLSASARAGGTSAGDLASIMERMAPTAHAMGVSLEDASTVMALLGQAGVKGERGAMALQAMMTRLAGTGRNTKVLTQVMAKLGIDAYDAHKNLRPLPQLLADLNAKSAPLGNAMRQRIFSVMFGREAAASINAMFSAMKPDAIKQLTEQIHESEGATEKMSEAMDQTAENAEQRVAASYNTLATALGGHLLPSMTFFKNITADVVGGLAAWAAEHPTVSKVIMRTVQVLGFLTGAITTLITALAALKAAQGILFLVTGYTRFAAAISALVIPAIKSMTATIMSGTAAMWPYVAALGAVLLAYSEYQKYKSDLNMTDVGHGIGASLIERGGLSTLGDILDPTALFEDLGWKDKATSPTTKAVGGHGKQEVGGTIKVEVHGPAAVTRTEAHGGIELDVESGLAMQGAH